jgi:hypothetical protein
MGSVDATQHKGARVENGKPRTPGQTQEDILQKILRRIGIPCQLQRKRIARGSEFVLKGFQFSKVHE